MTSGINELKNCWKLDFYNRVDLHPRPAYVWKTMPVPVISALHGVVYGGGLQIALGADIRIADPTVKMSVMEIRWGLIPDMSASQTLRDLVRLDIAKELTFTGRIVNGKEAQQIGLVTSLRARAKISSQIFGVEAPGWQGAKVQ